jgi:triphosphoribosyl-dephospho-CoA synthetase
MQQSARRTQGARRFDSALERFASRATRRRLSPGGSADLLAGAIFLESLGRFRSATLTTPLHGAALQESFNAHP